MVMEDDCQLCSNFKEQVSSIVTQLQKTKPHWRLCLLGSHELGTTLCSRRATLASRDLQQGQLSTGLFAYLLHRRALPLLLSASRGAFPLAEQLDVALSSLEWGHCSRFTVGTALVASPPSQEGDSDVQLLGDPGARVHASLPSPVRDRLIGSDSSAPRSSELTGPPAQRRSEREVHPPDRSHLLLPPASIPSVKELSETNGGCRGMPVRVADVGSEKGRMLIANRRITSGSRVAYYLVKLTDTKSKHTWSDCSIHCRGRKYGDVFGAAGSGSFRGPGSDGVPYVGFIANEPTFGKQDVNARFSSAPPHPNGQHRFAIEAVSDIARGEEVCVCYGRWYQRSYPSHWD